MPLLVKLQTYFTKSNTPPWVFFFLNFISGAKSRNASYEN